MWKTHPSVPSDNLLSWLNTVELSPSRKRNRGLQGSSGFVTSLEDLNLLYWHCQQPWETENLKQRQWYSEHFASFLGESLSGCVWHSFPWHFLLDTTSLGIKALPLLHDHVHLQWQPQSHKDAVISLRNIHKKPRILSPSQPACMHPPQEHGLHSHYSPLYLSGLYWPEHWHIASGSGQQWDCFRAQRLFG